MNAKGIFALVIGVFLMVGATLASATLNYPAPFITGGQIGDTVVVIGNKAASSDVLGGIDIGANLQSSATTPATIVLDTNNPTVVGGKSEKITLGDSVNTKLGTELTDRKIDGLTKGTIVFDETDYDYHELVKLSNDLKVETSLTKSNKEYEDNAYMEIKEGGIVYQYKFDDNIDLSKVDEDNKLDIVFLGQALQIVDVTNDQITVELGKEVFIKTGEPQTITQDNKTFTVELKAVSTDGKEAVIVVNNIQKIMSVNSEAKFDGVAVRLNNAFSNSAVDAAFILIGSSTRKVFDDGDPYVGEDTNNPVWTWKLENLLSNNKDTIFLGVNYNLAKDNLDDGPVAVGECYNMPNNYIKVCMPSLTENKYSDIMLEYDDGYSNIRDVYASKTTERAFVLKAVVDNLVSIKMASSGKEVSEMVVWINDSANKVEVFYKGDDSKNKIYSDALYDLNQSVKVADILDGDTVLPVMLDIPATLASGKIQFRIVSPLANDDLSVPMNLDSGSKFVGIGTPETSEGSDLIYGTSTELGTRKENALTRFGIKVISPDGNSDIDRFKFSVTGDQQFANVYIVGTGSTVGTTSVTGSAGVNINAFTAPISVLDTEIGDYKSKNVIVVGGPCVNTVAAAILGTPADNCTSGFTEGKAMVRFIANTGSGKSALLVMGFSAQDTRNAANALAMGKLKGMTADDITIQSTGGLYSYSVAPTATG